MSLSETSSSSMSKIISNRPGFIVRFALPMVSSVFALIICAGCLIRYPIIISSKATVEYFCCPDSLSFADIRIEKQYFNDLRNEDSVRFFIVAGTSDKINSVVRSFTFVSKEGSADDFWIRIYLPDIARQNLTLTSEGYGNLEVRIPIKSVNLLQRIFGRGK